MSELIRLARQTITDLKAAHAEICKLQGIDPTTHTWPVWSSPAHTIAWCEQIIGAAEGRVETDFYDHKFRSMVAGKAAAGDGTDV